ncbi:MAG: methyl-accepting chemotaxis protein [Gemmatimonadetes bacterium]|nr:methyl-accepting chemotaxis protein [Gemmatimonadota bacterium]NIR99756.1 methyl-accepting chemotaxis protein [Gemmatimonadota bacterium]NIY42189.1 HAMP domain-containing protein [Gemmatimonadota bacterium]
MIRDFLLALTMIVVFEMGGRLLLAMNEFAREDREATEVAAEQLARDVKDIMLNRGGPVAARTVYPIIQRNHAERGLEIAIVPSATTVESIRETFDFRPRGVVPEWPEGKHHEATVQLEAEEFCLQCHVTAKVGDVLGHVAVRKYRTARIDEWWSEARVVSVVGMANVILHTIVLFLLLRLRMQPLLELRAIVARLAKGRLDFSRRAEAKSNDEFGELATDLNLFLDRVCDLIEDVNGVLGQVGAVNERLAQVSSQTGEQLESVHAKVQGATRQTYEIREALIAPSDESVESLDLVLSALETATPEGEEFDELRGKLREVLTLYRESAERTRAGQKQLDGLGESLMDLARAVQADTHYQGEIRVLEERMRVIAESGRDLLDRLMTREEPGSVTD